MTDTVNLGLPFIEGSQAQKHVTHNEALRILDALVMLSVLDRDLSAPPSSPVEGDRYIVKATGSGAFAGRDDAVAHYSDGGWDFYPPKSGWLCYVEDEGVLLAWDGADWIAASEAGGSPTELQNLSLLGIGTTADATNPLSAKLNNVLWTAQTVAEGGDGNLRYKMSKESVAKTLSLLFQDNYSGRAEIGLTGDDDFHVKTSADGSTWVDALLLDMSTGATKVRSGFFLTGDLSPSQITADQNDYNPAGLAGACVLRLSTDASRNVTGLAGGGDGRIVAIVNAGTNAIVLKDASTSSSAANRFSLSADITLAAKQSAVLWYDATDSRWKLLAGPQASGGGGGSVTSVATGSGLTGGPITTSGTVALDIVSLTEDTAPDLAADCWLTYDASASAHKKVKAINFTRERLAANRTYYVRTDGSDSNNGLANSSGGAFLTIQKAVDTILNTVDLAGYDVTIQVGNGTYTGSISVNGPWIGVGSGTVVLLGDATTPSNVLISVTGSNAITATNRGALNISGIKIQTTTSGHCLLAQSGGTITISGKVNFGASAGIHINANRGSTIAVGANYEISGGATQHFNALQNSIINTPSRALTLTANATFSTAFAAASLGAGINITGWSITLGGFAVTGTRYSVVSNGQIDTGGGGASYLPGNSAGSVATGGQYL